MLWVPLMLIVSALALRWMKLESEGMILLPNFSPWMALAFTGTLVMSQALPWFVWPMALLLINVVVLGISSALDVQSLSIYAIAAFVASRYRGRLSIAQGLLGVAACSLTFYLFTNTAAWITQPDYVKNFAGWLQANTTGIPGFAPTWTFLRSSLLSDLGFSALLMIACKAEARVRETVSMPWFAVAR
jgi:hypothetical protein